MPLTQSMLSELAGIAGRENLLTAKEDLIP
jgi:hypothetical protein